MSRGARVGLVWFYLGLREPGSAAAALARLGGTKWRDKPRTEVKKLMLIKGYID